MARSERARKGARRRHRAAYRQRRAARKAGWLKIAIYAGGVTWVDVEREERFGAVQAP